MREKQLFGFALPFSLTFLGLQLGLNTGSSSSLCFFSLLFFFFLHSSSSFPLLLQLSDLKFIKKVNEICIVPCIRQQNKVREKKCDLL